MLLAGLRRRLGLGGNVHVVVGGLECDVISPGIVKNVDGVKNTAYNAVEGRNNAKSFSFAFFTDNNGNNREGKWNLDELKDLLVIPVSAGGFVGAIVKLNLMLEVRRVVGTQT